MAPEAKLSVMDLGKPGSGLCIPAAGPLYNPGRLAGSRIGSNSWGTAYVGAGYYNSQDTDNYLFTNMVRAATVEKVNTYMTYLSYRTPPYSSRRAILASPEHDLSRCRPVARIVSLWAPGRHG